MHDCCIETRNKVVTQDQIPCWIFWHPILQLYGMFAKKNSEYSLITEANFWAFELLHFQIAKQ